MDSSARAWVRGAACKFAAPPVLHLATLLTGDDLGAIPARLKRL